MSTRDTIAAFLHESFFVDGFSDDDGFLETGILDSMGMLQLVAFLEETFGVRPSDEELVPQNLGSLRRVCAFVERKRSHAIPA